MDCALSGGRPAESLNALAPTLRTAVPALAALAWLAASGAWAQRIVVITSAETTPYQQAVAGMRSLGPAVEALRATNLDESNVASLIGANQHDTAIVTLGASAAAVASRVAPSLPTVNCMTGGDDVPLDAQVAALKRILPNAQRVGILFDPAHNERRSEDAAAAFRRAGYTTVVEPVTDPPSLPAALSRLTGRVDVLFALPDTTVYAREHSRALLMYSFRHHVPLAGPAEAWVKTGALYALDWDYADLGRYCGALALRQLAGGKGPAPAAPRMRLVANGRSAEQLRVPWDEATLRSFDKVYQ